MPRKKSENFDVARSELMKKKYADDPEFYKRVCEHNKAFGNDPEERKRRSDRMKDVWKREDIRTKIITNMRGKLRMGGRPSPLKGIKKSKEFGENISKKNKGKKRTQESKNKISKGRKAYWAALSPEDRVELINKIHKNRSGLSQERWKELIKFRYNNDPEYKERCKEQQRKYTQTPEYKESHRRSSHKRRVKVEGLEFSLTLEQWNKIIELQKNKCILCGKKFTLKNPATKDHIIPVMRAGPYTMENTQAAHRDCNSSKRCKIDKSNIVSWISRPDLC